jgi:hypothetical protein
LLTDEFLKQFKSRDGLYDFPGKLQKRGIEVAIVSPYAKGMSFADIEDRVRL